MALLTVGDDGGGGCKGLDGAGDDTIFTGVETCYKLKQNPCKDEINGAHKND